MCCAFSRQPCARLAFTVGKITFCPNSTLCIDSISVSLYFILMYRKRKNGPNFRPNTGRPPSRNFCPTRPAVVSPARAASRGRAQPARLPRRSFAPEDCVSAKKRGAKGQKSAGFTAGLNERISRGRGEGTKLARKSAIGFAASFPSVARLRNLSRFTSRISRRIRLR